MNKKKVLLTGSLSFIGSNLIRKAIYNKLPYEFCSIDKIARPTQSLKNQYYNKDHSFYMNDICDDHAVNKIFEHEKPEIVIHMAAESSVDASINDPNVFIKSNVLGTQVIINACLKHNVEKMIYISTDEVMGHLQPDEQPWDETAPLNPRNPYAASKASGELLVKAAGQTHDLNYIITRSSNNYGPYQTSDKLIPRVIKCILNKELIPVYGNGLNTRSWIYVYDNCSALFKVLEKGKNNEIYNIGTNQEYSNIEVIQHICNTMNDGHSLIQFVKDRAGHDFRYAVNTDKVKSLGWEPLYKFKDGLKETIDWYINNKWFLK